VVDIYTCSSALGDERSSRRTGASWWQCWRSVLVAVLEEVRGLRASISRSSKFLVFLDLSPHFWYGNSILVNLISTIS
jgi:hypothetical protein